MSFPGLYSQNITGTELSSGYSWSSGTGGGTLTGITIIYKVAAACPLAIIQVSVILSILSFFVAIVITTGGSLLSGLSLLLLSMLRYCCRQCYC